MQRNFEEVPDDYPYFAISLITELKTYHPSCSIYKHDAFDTADPSIMQDACYITDLAHYRVSVAQW